jgi:hypothetical protein
MTLPNYLKSIWNSQQKLVICWTMKIMKQLCKRRKTWIFDECLKVMRKTFLSLKVQVKIFIDIYWALHWIPSQNNKWLNELKIGFKGINRVCRSKCNNLMIKGLPICKHGFKEKTLKKDNLQFKVQQNVKNRIFFLELIF